MRAAGDEFVDRFFETLTANGNATGARFTDQGVYVASAAGDLLASGNKLDAAAVLDLLDEGERRYRALDRETRVGEAPPDPPDPGPYERLFPEDGLVLQLASKSEYAADAPTRRRGFGRRAGLGGDYLKPPLNFDYAWFTKSEARSFLPEAIERGAEHDVPRALVERLARLHFVGTARALAAPYETEDLEVVELRVEVRRVTRKSAEITLKGRARAVDADVERVRGRATVPSHPERGFDVHLVGEATFALEDGGFSSFELIAIGEEWGGVRTASPEPRRYSVHMSSAREDDTLRRTKPLLIEHYGAPFVPARGARSERER